jgi:hypothetical protein
LSGIKGFIRELRRAIQPDPEADALWARYQGRVLAELLKTRVNRHRLFWVGRGHDGSLRVGVEFSTGSAARTRRVFFDYEDFINDPRISSYKLMTPAEADAAEAALK